ncbi:hypothetical protein IFM46972_00188 [Aspergillus udagawae]|uniref:Uncharacterized protein n=1 Tax=Aspergillus udagawae TaxID=91492 RepID=A0A8H3N1C5_9EURO|nr:hypothetical protein IFM46972_00188 [Aspergillus udagawae]
MSPSESDSLRRREAQDGIMGACGTYQESIWHLVQPPDCPCRWDPELTARLGDAFTILLFHGNSAHSPNYMRKPLTVDTLDELKVRLEALNYRDVQTSRTTVLSSYSTWATRTVFEVDGKGKGRQVDGADDSDDETPDDNMLAIEQLASLQEVAETVNDDHYPCRGLETTRTIVLSSYTTWALCTMYEVDPKGKGRQVESADDGDDGDGANDTNDDSVLAIGELADLQAPKTVDDDTTVGEPNDFGPG